jgi:DNA-binding NarL/FixJ family response regulator
VQDNAASCFSGVLRADGCGIFVPLSRRLLARIASSRNNTMIKIGIVDDHAVVRTGLKAFFSTFVDFRVVGEAGSGREAIDLVRTADIDVLVMDLSMPGQSGIDALAMVRAEEIAKAIRTVALGRRYISPSVAELLAGQLERKDNAPPHKHLSEREFQVFLKLAKGESVGAIGEALSLSVKTISTYRTRLMEKMNLSTNSDLTYNAIKTQLID